MMGFLDLIFGISDERMEKKIEKLEREWDEAVRDGDNDYAALIHWEIKQKRKKADKGGWF